MSGHAHSGQMKMLNRGLYLGGQGLFASLVDGLYFEHRLLVRPRVCNTHKFTPRLGR